MGSSMDEWKMTLATCALIVCMLWDIVLGIVKDYVKVPSWIPARLFVLNALTILIVGNVDIEKGNALSPSDQHYLEVLVHKQLKMDAARLTMCVFVGCILTGVTIVQTEEGWSSLAALSVSLSFHVATEIYALQNGNSSTAGPWFVSSGAILSLGASSLLLLLGEVMLLCKVGRHVDFVGIYEILSKDKKNEGVGWETLRRQVMKSWFAVRVWKTDYYFLSSSIVPGATVIVTICVVVMAAKVGCHSSLLHQSNEGGNDLTFYLQCIFILVGWILMLRRWLRRMHYFCENEGVFKSIFLFVPTKNLEPIGVLVKPLLLSQKCHYSLDPIGVLRFFVKNRKLTLRGILIFLPCAVVLLLLCVLIIPVTLLWSFCFVCWYFSNLVFPSLFKRHKESVLANAKNSKYQSMLDGFRFNENEKYVFWKLNKKSFDRINSNIDEVSKIEEKCKGLLSIMGIVRLSESQQLRLHDRKEHSWMGAVYRIFKVIVDAKVGVDMEDALDAYRETKDVLMFGDCPDNIVVDPLNIVGSLNLKSFFENMAYEVEMLKVASLQEKPKKVDGVRSTDQERKPVDKLVEKLNDLGKEMFNSTSLVRHEECSHYNLEELGKMLRSLVGRVIVSSILEVPDVLVKYSKKWAENMDEEKIERGIEIAGKVSALLERLVEIGDIEAAVGPTQ